MAKKVTRTVPMNKFVTEKGQVKYLTTNEVKAMEVANLINSGYTCVGEVIVKQEMTSEEFAKNCTMKEIEKEED